MATISTATQGLGCFVVKYCLAISNKKGAEMYCRYSKSLSALISIEFLSRIGVECVSAVFKKCSSNKAISILDSGVYSMRQRGEVPTNAMIINAYKSLPFKPTYVVNVDDGTFEEQYKSAKDLQQHGINVLPVIHDYFTKEQIDTYLHDFDYVSIGTGGTPELTASTLAYIFAKTRGRKKIHALGISSETTLHVYPFYSVDASTFTVGWQYLEMPYFSKGKMKRAKFLQAKKTVPLAYLNKDRVAKTMTHKQILGSGEVIVRECEKYQSSLTHYWSVRGIDYEETHEDTTT